MTENGPRGTVPAGPAVEDETGRQRQRSTAVALMLVAALFSGAVVGVMIATHFSEPAAPPDSPTLQSVRVLLSANPQSQELKDALRQEDQRVRQGFFTRRHRLVVGAWMLLVGLAATVICARWYASLENRIPRPSTPAERADAERWLGQRRRSVIALGAVGALLSAGLLAVALLGGRSMPPGTDEPDAATAEVPPPGAPTESVAAQPDETVLWRDNWPRFRGPDGTGVVQSSEWPKEWDAATDANVLWKTPVPSPGNSSPLLWGNRIFLTGADADRQDVFCFERNSGKLLWATPVLAPRPEVTQDDIEVMAETGYASPTPATDGERVYVAYASSDIAALDFDGKIVWARNLGKPESMYGRATSLLLHGGRVIVQFDRGMEPDEGLSALLALEGKTGQTVWNTPRPVQGSWSTPILLPLGDGSELVTNGSPWVIAYDPETGEELWRCAGMGGDVACSPTFADGLVFVTNEGARALAIRPGGRGDVTETHVAWTAQDGLPDAASPVASDGFFLQATGSGRITCYGAGTGELIWEDLLGSGFWASPTIAGNYVYLPGDDGKVYILELADEFRLTATCDLGEPLLATPAFGDGCIYFRGDKSLFCIGSAEKTP